MLATSKRSPGPTFTGVCITIAVALVLSQFQHVLFTLMSAFYLICGMWMLSIPILHWKKLLKEGKSDLIAGAIVGGVCVLVLGLISTYVVIKLW